MFSLESEKTFESKSDYFLNRYWKSSMPVVLTRAVGTLERLIYGVASNMLRKGGEKINVNKKFMQKEIRECILPFFFAVFSQFFIVIFDSEDIFQFILKVQKQQSSTFLSHYYSLS